MTRPSKRCLQIALLALGFSTALAAESSPSLVVASVTVERTTTVTPDAAPTPPERMVLRLAPTAAAPIPTAIKSFTLEAGSYDDSEAQPLVVAAGATPAAIMSHEGQWWIEVSCAPPPRTAQHLVDLSATIELTIDRPAGEVSLDDVRPRTQRDLLVDGQAWYRVEDIGAKQMTLRRLSADAPAIFDLSYTNVRGDRLAVLPAPSPEIPDPGGGGWVAIVLFENHVPLVVNVVVPVAAAMAETTMAVHVESLTLP